MAKIQPSKKSKRKEKPEIEDSMEIDGSPLPGITPLQVLYGHTRIINRVAWSPDGNYLASPSTDGTIRIWNIAHGGSNTLSDHPNEVYSVAWSPDGSKIASASNNENIKVWDVKSGDCQVILRGHNSSVLYVAWSPDGDKLASSSKDATIRIWDTRDWKIRHVFNKHTDSVSSLAWSPDGEKILSGSAGNDSTVRVWNLSTGVPEMTLRGHSIFEYKGADSVNSVIWLPNTPYILSCSSDKTIRVWNTLLGETIHVLEGHTAPIYSLSLSSDNTLLVSTAHDGIRFWNTGTWETVLVIEEYLGLGLTSSVFHPHLSRLATPSKDNIAIRIWDVDSNQINKNILKESVRYTTAKLVLVGDSGVGKTGLGWRLAHNEFKEHSSTHGQQFWVVPELGFKREDDTECEAVLWDLAGQHIYRPIHSIFLDNVDAALILFDPSNRQDPLKGAQFWLEQLKGKKKLPLAF